MESFKSMAPVRADLAGGTLDLWPLYCLLGEGRTINIALDLMASAHFEWLPSVTFRTELHATTGETVEFDEPLSTGEIARLAPGLRFPAAIVSAFLRQQDALPEKLLRIRLETQAPLGSGLGGSSALCVALVRGLSRLFNLFVEQGWQWKMLEWVRDVEAGFLKTVTGTQDYLSAMFGSLSSYRSRIGGIERDGYDSAVFDGLSKRLVVLFSGEMHHSGMSNWELFKRALEGDTKLLGGMERIHLIADQLDHELRAATIDWSKVGRCFNEEWEVRSATLQVNTPRLDEIFAFLSTCGVLGAKVCGAAQGGSLIALIDPDRRDTFVKQCAANAIQVLATQPTREGVHIVDPKKVRQPVY